MKIRKLNNKYVPSKSLGYTFATYQQKDDNNNTCFILTVLNKELKIKKHVLLTNPTYIVGMFDDKIKEYLFNVIEQSINLKIDSLGLSDVLSIERSTDSFIVHKADSVLYETAYIPDYDNYDQLYSNLEDIVTNYKNYF